MKIQGFLSSFFLIVYIYFFLLSSMLTKWSFVNGRKKTYFLLYLGYIFVIVSSQKFLSFICWVGAPSGFGGSWSSLRSSSEDDEPKFYNGKRNLLFTWGRDTYRFRTDYWMKVKETQLVFRHLQKVSIPMFVLLQLVHNLAEVCWETKWRSEAWTD